MIATGFVTGSPCWLDLGAPDVKAAAAFYGAVFDWEFHSFGPDAGGYGSFRLDGRSVGALGPLTEAGARSAWMIYFGTPDADASARTVERWHGTVRVAPGDVDGEGRMAQFTDPLGARFAVWEPGRTQGLGMVNEPGAMIWTELYTTDADAAKKFYGDLFGWETHELALPGDEGGYTLIAPANGGQENTQGGVMQMPADDLAPVGPSWHPVFQVVDCDEAADRIASNGGQVLKGPADAEGVGRLAACVDPSGADFVVLAPRAD